MWIVCRATNNNNKKKIYLRVSLFGTRVLFFRWTIPLNKRNFPYPQVKQWLHQRLFVFKYLIKNISILTLPVQNSNQTSFRKDWVYFSTHNTIMLVVFLSAEPKTHFLPLKVSVTDSFLQTGVMTLYWSCSTHSAFLFPLFINIFAETICFFSSYFSPSHSCSIHLFFIVFLHSLSFPEPEGTGSN